MNILTGDRIMENETWGEPFKIGRDEYRFTDDWFKAGFIKATPADKIVRLQHEGWYTDDFCDGTYRGHVFQPEVCPDCYGEGLVDGDDCTTCNGAMDYPQVFYPGYISNYAEDGFAVVAVEPMEHKRDAAIRADKAARDQADKEREYDRAWRDGQRLAELEYEHAELREDYENLGLELPRRGPVLEVAAQKLDRLEGKIKELRDGYSFGTDAFKDGYADGGGRVDNLTTP